MEVGLERLDRLLPAGYGQVHRRPSRQHRQVSSHHLALATTKTLKCSLWHLITRTPVTVTKCCLQWLGCQRSTVQYSARRCPLCNTSWTAANQPISIRGLDDLATVGKEVGKFLGRQHLHSSPEKGDVTSSYEDLPALASAAATQSAQQAAAMADTDAGLSSREPRHARVFS